MPSYDAVVVGAGPNGLAAAIRLAQEDLHVLLVEGSDEIGGGCRSAEVTRPGFVHDLCSAIHPMAVVSPFFRSLALERFGLEWIHPTVPLAHPLDGGHAAVMFTSMEQTAEQFGPDAAAYRDLMAPLCENWSDLSREILQPMLHLPKRPVMLAKFGLHALQSAHFLARRTFRTEEPRALFAGMAAHSLISLNSPASAAIGLVLATAGHSVGWPMPRGGAQSITNALADCFRSLGGEIRTGFPVRSLDELPGSECVILNLTVRQFLRLAGERMPVAYRKRLEAYRYGPAVFKLDYAMREPVPWEAAACASAGTIHLGGTLDEIVASEHAVTNGRHAEKPFVLLAEHSRFDRTRAPGDAHTLWAYCHVPLGSRVDMTDAIENQIERFAPGFRDCILERHAMRTADFERRNENMVGGDINGGSATIFQLLSRPVPTPTPYRTPVEGVYLSSASTPPGGGVHGMGGFYAAEAAIRDVFRRGGERGKR